VIVVLLPASLLVVMLLFFALKAAGPTPVVRALGEDGYGF